MTMAARNMRVIRTSVTSGDEPIGVRGGVLERLLRSWAVAGWLTTATVPNSPMAAQQTRAAEALAKEATSATSVGPTMNVTSCRVASMAYRLDCIVSGTRALHRERTDGATGGTLAPATAAITRSSPNCPTGAKAIVTRPAVLTAVDPRSTGRRPMRSARRPTRGPASPVPMTYAAVTAPARAYEPLARATRRMMARLTIATGSRATSDVASSQLTPGARSTAR